MNDLYAWLSQQHHGLRTFQIFQQKLDARSTWPQASIFELTRTTGSPTSIVLQRATSCIGRVKPQWAGRRGPPSVACHARQRRIMPPSLGKQTSIAQAEPHGTNRSLIDRRKACGWRACPRAEKNERCACPFRTSCEFCSCVGC